MMATNNAEQLQSAQQQIAVAARALLVREPRFIDGIRRMLTLRNDVTRQDHDPDFMPFVAVDSCTDHIPDECRRVLCTAAWLEACDREMAEVQTRFQAEVDAACERLLTRYAHAEQAAVTNQALWDMLYTELSASCLADGCKRTWRPSEEAKDPMVSWANRALAEATRNGWGSTDSTVSCPVCEAKRLIKEQMNTDPSER